MLPFWNVLNSGIVAAFATIEEIPTIIEMRIDRKNVFLALSDFPIDTPPAFFFLPCLCNLLLDGDCVSRPVIMHIEKTFSADIVVSRGLLAKSAPYYDQLPSPLFFLPIVSSVISSSFRLTSKLCVPFIDIQLFAERGDASVRFSCRLRFRFRLPVFCFAICLCRSSSASVSRHSMRSGPPVASNCAFFAPIVYFPVFCFPVLLNCRRSYNIM